MNNTDGLKNFLKYEKGHEVVADCLDHRKPQVMIQALKILAALCFLEDKTSGTFGVDKMLAAITKVSDSRNMPRFLPIVNAITKSGNNADLQVKSGTFCLFFHVDKEPIHGRNRLFVCLV